MSLPKQLTWPLVTAFFLLILLAVVSHGSQSRHNNLRQPVIVTDGLSAQAIWNSPLPSVTFGGLGMLLLGYSSISVVVARRLAYETPLPITTTPAACGLEYRSVIFPSRAEGIVLHGWLVPGVLPNRCLTLQRTIIAIHGARQNRTDPAAGLDELTCQLAHQGFAVLTFDLRGHGESTSAPFTLGYYEQRDILGAVDFLRSGVLPFPELGRPEHIGGWGVSSGANALLLAAAHEPALQVLVADSAYPDMLPILQHNIPKESKLPPFFTRGTLIAAHLLYGLKYTAIRPIDVLAGLAPRPLLLIQGAADTFNPPTNLKALAHAAAATPAARVESWQVAGAAHAQSFHTAGAAYIQRVTEFFTMGLGVDTSAHALIDD